MKDSLALLERTLADQQPDYLAGLREGADPEGLQALCAELGLSALPPELEALLRWRDPLEPPRWNFEADDTWWLLSRGGVASAHAALCSRYEDAAGALYDSRWIPFLRNGSGDCLCVVAESVVADGQPAGSGGPGVGQVVEVAHGSLERPVRFGSLVRWLQLTLEGLEGSLLRIEEDGGFHPANPFAWEEFLEERNPGFCNGDPAPEAPRSQTAGSVALLRRAGAGLGTLSLVALTVTAKVFRSQLPRAGFMVIVLGFALAGLFLLAAQVLLRQHAGVGSGVQRDQALGAVGEDHDAVEREDPHQEPIQV